MIALIALISIVAVTKAIEMPLMGDSLGLQQAFVQFKKLHKKSYSSLTEEKKRFSIFTQSIEKAHGLNQLAKSKGSTARYGINILSDLTDTEFRSTYLTGFSKKVPSREETLKLRDQHRDAEEDAAIDASLPQVVDWVSGGLVTPVKNQGQCGSCWAFSATEQLESAWIRAGRATNLTIDLAPQQIVDCDDTSMGCGGGTTQSAYATIMAQGGMESNATYPYQAVNGQCHFDKSKVVASMKSYKSACSWWGEAELRTNLAEQPVSICVDASKWQHYTSGVMTGWECDYDINFLDHCVQAVGYNSADSTPYYVVRNSWTKLWGLDGYIRLTQGENTCGLTDSATIVEV